MHRRGIGGQKMGDNHVEVDKGGRELLKMITNNKKKNRF